MGGLLEKPFTLTIDAGGFEVTHLDLGNDVIVVDQSNESESSGLVCSRTGKQLALCVLKSKEI